MNAKARLARKQADSNGQAGRTSSLARSPASAGQPHYTATPHPLPAIPGALPFGLGSVHPKLTIGQAGGMADKVMRNSEPVATGNVVGMTKPAGPAQTGEVAPEVEQSIQRRHGGGQALDDKVRAQMEPAFGADFGGVRVHTDAAAHACGAHATGYSVGP